MTDNQAIQQALAAVGRPLYLTVRDGQARLALDGAAADVVVPACPLENLGDAAFRADHRLRYAYVAGAMANGIGSCEIVEAMSRAGMVGFFGAAGLPPPRVEAALERIQKN